MIAWRAGTVMSLGRRWQGAREVTVDVSGDPVAALVYDDVVGPVEVGARLLLNVTALDRGLGTGGYALVVARTDLVPADPEPGPGHLVKARYTPQQIMVLGVDDQESTYHEVLQDADDLDGLPVVTADLHSALPAVVAGARCSAGAAGRPAPRVAYVMTDGGALPAAFSRTVAALRETGWLSACITAGQAYGGDLEAVSVHSALLAARLVVGADLVVVSQGPGNLGTDTRWGFSGVLAGDAVNAAATLNGRPVASLRVSGADPRPRHRGISHHSLTAYGRVALATADVPVPVFDGLGAELDALASQVRAQASALAVRHRLVDVPAGGELLEALRGCPFRLSTMGRGLDDDPGSFLAAAVAGVHAEGLAAG